MRGDDEGLVYLRADVDFCKSLFVSLGVRKMVSDGEMTETGKKG